VLGGKDQPDWLPSLSILHCHRFGRILFSEFIDVNIGINARMFDWNYICFIRFEMNKANKKLLHENFVVFSSEIIATEIAIDITI
jgi:hypothetical protein